MQSADHLQGALAHQRLRARKGARQDREAEVVLDRQQEVRHDSPPRVAEHAVDRGQHVGAADVHEQVPSARITRTRTTCRWLRKKPMIAARVAVALPAATALRNARERST